jgi:UDPglucose--hexose-1-phosphate uridylyltransferase
MADERRTAANPVVVDVVIDPIGGHSVVFAPERASRPVTLGAAGGTQTCPFCPGNEAQTTPEVFALRADGSPPNGPGWKLRVVTNKYRIGPPAATQEVIIETPEHDSPLHAREPRDLRVLLATFRDRLRAAGRTGDPRYAVVFRNEGFAAGATLAHPHAQCFALDVLPEPTANEYSRAIDYRAAHGVCYWCAMIADEIARGACVVARNERFVALTQRFGRYPCETLVLPLRHGSRFEQAGDGELEALSETLRELLGGFARFRPGAAFNLVLHTAPPHGAPPAFEPAWHWRLAFVPRLTVLGGFEVGTALYVNPVEAESAARALRAPNHPG